MLVITENIMKRPVYLHKTYEISGSHSSDYGKTFLFEGYAVSFVDR
jgi:hypothetical protein